MLANGGMAWTTSRTAASSGILYDWAVKSPLATPVRGRPGTAVARWSPPSISPTRSTRRRSSAVLRENGIVDTDSYRKLGRNQLRIGMFPAVDPADVEALTACIDYVLDRL